MLKVSPEKNMIKSVTIGSRFSKVDHSGCFYLKPQPRLNSAVTGNIAAG